MSWSKREHFVHEAFVPFSVNQSLQRKAGVRYVNFIYFPNWESKRNRAYVEPRFTLTIFHTISNFYCETISWLTQCTDWKLKCVHHECGRDAAWIPCMYIHRGPLVICHGFFPNVTLLDFAPSPRKHSISRSWLTVWHTLYIRFEAVLLNKFSRVSQRWKAGHRRAFGIEVSLQSARQFCSANQPIGTASTFMMWKCWYQSKTHCSEVRNVQ